MGERKVTFYYRLHRATESIDKLVFAGAPIDFEKAQELVKQWNTAFPTKHYSIDDPSSKHLITLYTHTYRDNVSKMRFEHPLTLAEAVKQTEVWNHHYGREGHSYAIIRPEDESKPLIQGVTCTDKGITCPNGCKGMIEKSQYAWKGSHYCTECENWFTPSQTQPLAIPPAESESPMKLTVNRQSLIDSLQAELDKRQKAYDNALATYNSALEPVQTLVASNFPKANTADQTAKVNVIAVTLNLAAPMKDSSIAVIQQKVNLLKMATDTTLELEDNSPYLGWL